MPYRMLRYMLRIWERWWRAQPSTPTRLPVIVPLLLSNAELVGRKELVRAVRGTGRRVGGTGPHLLDLTLRIDDLPAQTSVSLRAGGPTSHWSAGSVRAAEVSDR